MVRLTLAALAVSLAAACATPLPQGSAKPDINLFASEPDKDVINTKFAAEIAHRYHTPADLAVLKTDFTANGFTCADVPPGRSARRIVPLKTRCELAKPHGFCTDQWNVELRYAPGWADLNRPTGQFWRSCSYPKEAHG